MKLRPPFLPLVLILVSLTASTALYAAHPKPSRLDNDPAVIYLNQHIDHPIYLLVAQPLKVYSSRKGGRRLGIIPANTKVELLAITDKAFRIKGKAFHGNVIGWVNPKLLASKDKNFIANLKKFYHRQIAINALIAQHDIAIGMTLEEVTQSLGEPTETESKQTRQGKTGKWHYVISEEQKHYRTLIDRHTGQIYRQLSHVTIEEKQRTTIEFTNNIVTAISRKKNNGPGKIRIIPAPIIFHWSH